MAIAVRTVTVGTDAGGSATVTATTPSGGTAAQVGDLLVILHTNDFYALTNMVLPTVTGSPTVTAITGTGLPADGGTNEGHIKPYWAVVNTGGAQTVSTTETGSHDEEKALVVYVLTGADTTTPIDVAAGFNGTPGNENQTCPSVTTTTTDAFLLCHDNSGPTSTAAYGSPGSMTEQYEIHVGGMSGVGATEQLAASGATGTRTFTTVAGDNILWVSVSIALRTATVASALRSPVLVVPSYSAIHAGVW